MAEEKVQRDSHNVETSYGGGCLVIFILLLVLFVLLMALAILFDYLGIIPLRENLPPALLRYKIVQDYIRVASYVEMTPEERIRARTSHQEKEYEKQVARLKQEEIRLKEELVTIEKRKKELEDWGIALMEREKSLLEREKMWENRASREVEMEQRVRSMARILEKMTPLQAATALRALSDTFAVEILLNMTARKAAAIMDSMESRRVSEILESIKKSGKTGEVKIR